MLRLTVCLSAIWIPVYKKVGKGADGPKWAIQVMARGLGGKIGENTSGRFVLTGAPFHLQVSGSSALTIQYLQGDVVQVLSYAPLQLRY